MDRLSPELIAFVQSLKEREVSPLPADETWQKHADRVSARLAQKLPPFGGRTSSIPVLKVSTAVSASPPHPDWRQLLTAQLAWVAEAHCSAEQACAEARETVARARATRRRSQALQREAQTGKPDPELVLFMSSSLGKRDGSKSASPRGPREGP
jgi:hypothetical protein